MARKAGKARKGAAKRAPRKGLAQAEEAAGVFDVVCVGSSTLDVFAKTEADLIKIKTGTHEEELIAYPVGSKILVKELHFEIGGGGTNTAVAFARLGLKTAYLGNVGNDANSERILTLLRKEGISFVGQQQGMAGFSVILDSIEEDRTILTYKGANDSFTLSPARLRALKTRWIYSSSMMGKSVDALHALARLAKRTGTKLAFNPSTYMVRQGLAALRPVLDATTVLVFNREEAQILTGKQDATIPDLMRTLHHFGIPYVGITDGKNGSYVSDKKQILFAAPGKLKVIETTGAGDGFASAFVTGLVWGQDLKTCLRMGMVEAEQVVTHLGAKTALLTNAGMARALACDKHKVVRVH